MTYNNKTGNYYIRACQKVEKWKNDFYFWKTPYGRPTNDSSKKVTWIHNDPENEIVTCWICKNYPSECDQDIVSNNIAFNKYPRICDLQELNNIQLGNDIV